MRWRSWLLGLVCSLHAVSSGLFAAQITTQLAVGTVTTVLTTEMNSLGNTSYSNPSAILDNRIGQALNGYLICRMEGNFTFAANPTANTAVIGWFLKSLDGVNFENTPDATHTLGRPPDFVLPVTTGQTGTRVSVDVLCPGERFKVLIRNDSTGQAMGATGNTVKILPFTWQGN